MGGNYIISRQNTTHFCQKTASLIHTVWKLPKQKNKAHSQHMTGSPDSFSSPEIQRAHYTFSMQSLKTIPFPETTFPRRESCQFCCSKINPCLVLRSAPPFLCCWKPPAPKHPQQRHRESRGTDTAPYLVLLLGTQTLPGPARAALRQSQSFCESCAALNHPEPLSPSLLC